MRINHLLIVFTFLVLFLTFIACGDVKAVIPNPTEAPIIPTVAQEQKPVMPLATTEPGPTINIDATVFENDPYVPILIFHQFAPRASASVKNKGSTEHKVLLDDFENELEALNAAGFTLVPVQDWIKGNLTVPAGRRPLIFTMDDLFFNNQIGLLEDGTPDPNTGIGVLWSFYKQHEEFGFNIALFANLGDKLYADPEKPDWKMKLANTIVWCIENGAMPYNHTYSHADLSKTDYRDVKWELRKNDLFLRELLELAGRQDLLVKVDNFLGLPYGIWPDSKNSVILYRNPEDEIIQAVFEADFHYYSFVQEDNTKLFMPPPYSDSFDQYQIPRIAATERVIESIITGRDQIPVAKICTLGPVYSADLLTQSDVLKVLIADAVTSGKCPTGIYFVNGFTFRANPDVSLIY